MRGMKYRKNITTPVTHICGLIGLTREASIDDEDLPVEGTNNFHPFVIHMTHKEIIRFTKVRTHQKEKITIRKMIRNGKPFYVNENVE